ncbi:MAG TPA: type IV pilus twitching motility protein PilT [Candidatus Aminicenantes bacterium]|nr:type IV pilus twitching motility protein PilT [Candidatus Aminicenantes bacterium]
MRFNPQPGNNGNDRTAAPADGVRLTNTGQKKREIPSPPPKINRAPAHESAQRSASPGLDDLFRLMHARGASDLHLSTNCKPVLRIDGDIVHLEQYPPVTEEGLTRALVRIMPESNREEFNRTHDTDFGHALPGLARFRCNAFRDIRGVGLVSRLIPSRIMTIEELGIPESLVNLCRVPKGLILVTGPTGSGKSTTLAALIDHINRTSSKHIVTVEDPVEFVYENNKSIINQRELHTHTFSFKSALKAALREDPDVILVGEMRDLETISIAMEMATTGHLVLGTLHTSTAIATVNRIIDQFPANHQAQIRTMLAESLIGVCSQTLLKRKTGGRIAAYEVLIGTVGVSNLIREGKNFQIATMMQTGKKQGMKMLNTALSELVAAGEVEAGEAMEKAIDKENLKIMLQFNHDSPDTGFHDGEAGTAPSRGISR